MFFVFHFVRLVLKICFIVTDAIAVQMNAIIADDTISTGVVQNPRIPSAPLPKAFRIAPEMGTRIRRCIRYIS